MQFHVGNLTHGATVGQLAGLFEPYGLVERIELGPGVVDGRLWEGWARVTMPDDSQAEAAWKALNRSEVAGRPLRIEPLEECSWAW